MTKRLLSLTDVAAHLSVSRPTAYKYVNAVGFPKPVACEPGSTARRWNVEDIETWRLTNEAVKDGASHASA